MALNNLFREKEIEDVSVTSCEPIYNDILLFKKNSKVTGIVKICFNCWQYEIIGTIANTETFGQGKDNMELKKILYPK